MNCSFAEFANLGTRLWSSSATLQRKFSCLVRSTAVRRVHLSALSPAQPRTGQQEFANYGTEIAEAKAPLGSPMNRESTEIEILERTLGARTPRRETQEQ